MNSLHSLLGPPSSDTFLASIHISEADTYKILKEIDASKSCGPGNIPGRLLREGAAHLAGPLSQLFNLSIQTGTLPTHRKRPDVTPIFKKEFYELSTKYPCFLLSSHRFLSQVPPHSAPTSRGRTGRRYAGKLLFAHTI